MKDIYKLISWTIRRTYKWLLSLWGLLLLAQIFLLVNEMRDIASSGQSSFGVLPFFVFTLVFLCSIAITAIPMLSASAGRSRSIYTIMGLPIAREKLLIGNILSGILCALSTLAIQICIVFALYVPKGFLREFLFKAYLARGAILPTDEMAFNGVSFIKDGLFLDIMSNEILTIFFPTSILILICELVILIAASLLFHCIFMHKGIKLAANVIICIIGAILCAILFVLCKNETYMSCAVICSILVIICSLSFWWAARSLRKSRNL